MRSKKPKLKEYSNPKRPDLKWRVWYTDKDGSRKDRKFKFKTAAEQFLNETEWESEELGIEIAQTLDKDFKREAFAAAKELDRFGKSILEVTREWIAEKEKTESKAKAQTEILLDIAVAEFMKFKRSHNLRERTLKSLENELDAFIKGREDDWVYSITNKDVVQWIGNTATPRTAINRKQRLNNFFKWAEGKGYCDSNPVAGVRTPKQDEHEPEILTIAQCRKLMTEVESYEDGLMVPYHVLGLFAGLRPKEMERITWEDIDLEEGEVTIGGKAAKMRARRVVELTDNVIEWLLPHSIQGSTIYPKNARNHLDEVRKKAELIPWPHDAMRHTAISAKLRTCRNEGEVADWAGNSPNVIHKHYKGLMNEKQSKLFWQIRRGGKVVEFETAV